jgi:hypothetical protein
MELIKRVPLLHKKEVVDVSIKQFCETARAKFERGEDFESKRQFLLEYVEKIVYWNEKIEFHGSVPIKLKVYDKGEEKTEIAKIDFCIKDTILKIERFGRKDRKPNFNIQITKMKHGHLFENT